MADFRKGKDNPRFIDRTGEKWTTTELYEITIIKYVNKNNCDILFNDSYKTIVNNCTYNTITNGNIKNPYHISIAQIGYFGIGEYSNKENKKSLYSFPKHALKML